MRITPDAVIAQQGRSFAVGYSPTFCAVWDMRGGGVVTATFPRTEAGWLAAWHRYHELETRDVMPAWRQARAGWVVLHIAIGILGWFVQLFLIGIVVAASGKAGTDLSEAEKSAVGGAVLLTLPTGVASWLLFVYLRKPAVTRWIVFLAVLLAGFILATILALGRL